MFTIYNSTVKWQYSYKAVYCFGFFFVCFFFSLKSFHLIDFCFYWFYFFPFFTKFLSAGYL